MSCEHFVHLELYSISKVTRIFSSSARRRPSRFAGCICVLIRAELVWACGVRRDEVHLPSTSGAFFRMAGCSGVHSPTPASDGLSLDHGWAPVYMQGCVGHTCICEGDVPNLRVVQGSAVVRESLCQVHGVLCCGSTGQFGEN